MEIARAELSSNLLDFDYSHYNRNFTYVNAIPLECSPSPLKRIMNEEWNKENQGPVVVNYNPNIDRNHLNETWRKFTTYQVEYYNKYINSKLKLKGAIKMFSIRPLELLTLNNIFIFTKCLKISHKSNKE